MGGYIATMPELEGVSVFGATPSDALSELPVARDLWLEEVRHSGQDVPELEGVWLNTLLVQILSEARGHAADAGLARATGRLSHAL